MSRTVYMDCNASTPLWPEVLAVMGEVLEKPGNASSAHRFGQAARAAVEKARAQVAALVHADPSQVVFTSGGTEANALAIRGVEANHHIIGSAAHKSISMNARQPALIPMDGAGLLDLESLEGMLARAGSPALVCVMLANNETGVINPVHDIARLAHRYGAMVHCDAVQAAGRIAINMAALGADMISLSAHKMGGPQGVGALVVSPSLRLRPLIRGGGQERGLRGGTENTAGIAGFGKAAELALDHMEINRFLGRLRDRLEEGILALSPRSLIFGRTAPRLANTSCFTMPGVESQTQLMTLDLAGIAVSSGAACSSGRVEPSHVLRAMGATEEEARCAIRVSLGRQNNSEDIDYFLEHWGALYQRKTVPVSLSGRAS